MLSYDSDFYIFDGQYIPYVTITPKVYKKTVSSKSFEVEVVPKKQKGQKKIHRKTKKIVVETLAEPGEEVQESTYNYIDCCIYNIENLTDGVLENDLLPLFAIMLGNDFISRKWFAKFFRNVSRRNVKKKKNLSPQQKKIYMLLNWLQHETLKSAIKKILECVKHFQRPKLWFQIRDAMRGYRMTHSKSFEYFGFEEEPLKIEENEVLEMSLDELMASDDEVEEEEEAQDEEETENEEESGEEEEVENQENSEAEQENSENEEELTANEEEIEENGDGFEAKNSDDEDFNDPNEGKLSDEDEEPPNQKFKKRKFVFPDWFQEIYNSAAVPRFLVDILRCRRYINYPQVEEFSGNDSNTISYPILNLLYSLLQSPEILPLYYYTRVPKQARFEVKKIEPEIFPTVTDFDPSQKKNMKFMKMIFEKNFTNVEEIFESVREIPDPHQLYILAVIYWMRRSLTTNSNYLQAVLVGMIALSVVDKKCEKVHRGSEKFLKNFEKNLKELKAKQNLDINAESLKEIPVRSLIKNVTKHEAQLAMENLISHYSISPKFQRKHADFRRNVVHTFAELQSVVFNLFSLNPFLNLPFEAIKVENYFNGLFLYNMYHNLKSRANPIEYIRCYVFNHSPTIMAVFTKCYEICTKALPNLKIETAEISETVKKTRAKNTVKKLKKPPAKINDCEQRSESDNEFEDMNNKFSQLMKNAK